LKGEKRGLLDLRSAFAQGLKRLASQGERGRGASVKEGPRKLAATIKYRAVAFFATKEAFRKKGNDRRTKA